MEYPNLSEKCGEFTAGNIICNGEETRSYRRRARKPTAFQFWAIALALVVNVIITIKYTLPWLLSSALFSSRTTVARPACLGDSLGDQELEVQWPIQNYETEKFWAPDMRTLKTGETADGFLFITPKGNGTRSPGPAIMTEDNDLVWHGPAGETANFRVQSLRGKPVLTFWTGDSTATFGQGHGGVHILDDTYTKIAEVCMKNLDIRAPSDEVFPCTLDMHESYITDRGTLISTAYNVTKFDLSSVGGPKNGWIFDSLFYEIDIETKKVLFRWRSLDHVKKVPISYSHYPLRLFGIEHGRSLKYPWDYFHINSVQPTEDGGYLINSRHTFTVYKLNKHGDIEWHLEGIKGGDFTLERGIRFSWQHEPRIILTRGAEVRMTMFNNDNSEAEAGKHQTTALDLTLNTETMRATLNRKLFPQLAIYAKSMGSSQTLSPGHTLVGYGQIAEVKEYGPLGDVVYSARFGASTPQLLVSSYRAYRYEWRAIPKHPPKVAAESDGSLTHVYMSWNGATHVLKWAVWAGDSASNLERVAVVDRTSFETRVSLPTTVKYVRAEALKDGEEIGADTNARSSIQRVRSAR